MLIKLLEVRNSIIVHMAKKIVSYLLNGFCNFTARASSAQL